jgi:hypothetical protein
MRVILLDTVILKGILSITTKILKFNFFYDEESLERFFKLFENYIVEDYLCFEKNATKDVILQLKLDSQARSYFTSYFVSANLHDILVCEMHFTDSELDAFENLLPKLGVNHGSKPSRKRAYY